MKFGLFIACTTGVVATHLLGLWGLAKLQNQNSNLRDLSTMVIRTDVPYVLPVLAAHEIYHRNAY